MSDRRRRRRQLRSRSRSRGQGRTSRWRFMVGLCGLALTVWLIVVVRMVFLTNDTSPTSADAVVVFAGGAGERLDRALELIDADIAPVLVLNTGTDRWNDEAFDAQVALCPEAHVICVAANDTKTEAEAFAELAQEQGWSSMVAVTADYHLGRASRWLERCWDGRVERVAAPGPGRYVKVREMAAVTEMLVLDRGC